MEEEGGLWLWVWKVWGGARKKVGCIYLGCFLFPESLKSLSNQCLASSGTFPARANRYSFFVVLF